MTTPDISLENYFTALSGQHFVAFNSNTLRVPVADGCTTRVVSSLTVSFG